MRCISRKPEKLQIDLGVVVALRSIQKLIGLSVPAFQNNTLVNFVGQKLLKFTLEVPKILLLGNSCYLHWD